MEKKDQGLAEKAKARSPEQMKAKMLALVEKMLRGMQQPELAKIAFSVQHWQDDYCSEEELYIPAPPSGSVPKSSISTHNVKDSERRGIWRKKIRHKLAQTGKDNLISVIMEEAERMSYPNLQHLSQSLLALEGKKR
ncbi:MAG: hypothetical protein HY912_05740 [Desulfomonile tiedjei]|uniref:Uncharacterized protein n=1 Tax=Desulfomonile tiedjei TaxID=2358 RepID=A0A9D6V1G7_9BACT|nr:hypothetical protein [Desulfomonile tiedjei]